VAIDGLRSLAVLYVIVFHASWWSHLAPTQLFRNGYLAVELFFPISGFVIAAVYSEAITDGASYARFMVKRFFRIYPLHLAVLAAFVALELARVVLAAARGGVTGAPPFTGERSLDLLVQQVFLVHAWKFDGLFGWNAPSWSISTEFLAYILFGAVAVAAAPLRRFLHPVVGFALAGVLYAGMLAQWGTLNAPAPVVRCLAGFVLGAAVFGVARRTQLSQRFAQLAAGTRNAVELAVALATLAALATLSGIYAAAVVVPLFAVAIFLAQVQGGPVSRLLATRPFAFLGRISYSLYMVHLLCLFPVGVFLRRLPGAEVLVDIGDGRAAMAVDPWVGDAAIVVTLALVLLVSKYTFVWIEEPSRLFGRGLAARMRPRPIAAPAAA
jgi:peptidoglycan/LPS O-acetylase OafA/YrhL